MKNIHVLPTDKPSRLHEYDFLSPMGISKEYLQWRLGRNIYITSDEEIKDGDWVYSEKYKNVLQFKLPSNKYFYKKIILTTDQDLIADGVQNIDDKFLEWFVKNPICEFVEVEKDYYEEISGDDFFKKVNYYAIIIPKEEPKQELSFVACGSWEKKARNLK
jgi:hypothetical protein